MDDTNILFLVPEGYSAKLSASLTVDDWGKLTITDEKGNAKLNLSMTSDDSPAGERGCHQEWTKSDSTTLTAGSYTILVHHENVTYKGEYADKSKFNVAKCNFAIKATKEHVPQKVTATTKVIVKGHGPVMILDRPLTLSAMVTWKGDTPSFSDLTIEKFDRSPLVFVDPKGRINQIVIESITPEFVNETIIDETKNVAFRTAKVSWKARIWDYSDPDYTDEGRLVSGATDKDGATGNPVLAVSLRK